MSLFMRFSDRSGCWAFDICGKGLLLIFGGPAISSLGARGSCMFVSRCVVITSISAPRGSKDIFPSAASRTESLVSSACDLGGPFLFVLICRGKLFGPVSPVWLSIASPFGGDDSSFENGSVGPPCGGGLGIRRSGLVFVSVAWGAAGGW